jgi:hypothetical protein
MTPDDCATIWEIPFRLAIIHLPDVDNHSHISVTDMYKRVLRMTISMLKKNSGKTKMGFHCHGKLHPGVEEIIKEFKFNVNYRIHDRAGYEQDSTLEHRYLNGSIYCHHNGQKFRYNMLLPDGRVVLCHNDCSMRYMLGNLLETSYQALFSSPLIKELREGSIGPDSNILCRRCQDARYVSGENFSVWELPKWEAHGWLHGLLPLGKPVKASPDTALAAAISRLHGKEVYFWGCGELFHLKKKLFKNMRPRCILVDTAYHDLPDVIDGIPVCQPQDVLPQGEILPIIIFVQNVNAIYTTIQRDYPAYTDLIFCNFI